MSDDDVLRQILENADDAIQDDRESVAIELLTLYLQHKPDDAYAWNIFGDALRAVRRFDESERALLRAYKLASENLRVCVSSQLAQLYEDMGRFEDAERYHAQVADDPEWTEYGGLWVLRGANLTRLGNYKLAEECLRKAITLEEVELDEAWLNIGLVLRAQSKHEEARSALRKSLEFNSKCCPAVEALRSMKGIENTGAGHAHLCESDDTDIDWYREACRHDDDNNVGQALVCIEHHLRSKPGHLRAQFLYSRILADLRRFSDARSVLLELDLRKTHKLYWAVCDTWAHLYRTQGNYEDAVEWARRFIDSRPDWTSGYVYLGSCLARLGRFDEAVAAYEAATKIPADSENDPDEAYLNIGFIRRAQGRFDDALSALEHAIAIDPDYELYQRIRDDVLAAAKLQSEIDRA